MTLGAVCLAVLTGGRAFCNGVTITLHRRANAHRHPHVTCGAGLFDIFGGDRQAKKEKLLALINNTQRGLDQSNAAEVIQAFEDLERDNPCSAPLDSPELTGDWELLWTSSDSILGGKRPWFIRPSDDKPILQYLDAPGNFARNLEYTPLGPNTVEATISPLNREKREEFISRLDDFLVFKYGSEDKPGGTYIPDNADLEQNTAAVRFDWFKLFGFLSIKAPAEATGILQVTYLDQDLRLSRGDRGNLFVLRKASETLTQ